MVSLKATTPLQLVHLDFTSFESTMNLDLMPEVKNVLVIVDHFTRYMRAYVTKDHLQLGSVSMRGSSPYLVPQRRL